MVHLADSLRSSVGSVRNSVLLFQPVIRVLLVTSFGLTASGCCALQALLATPARTPIPPQPGEWTASAESLGEFVFEVSPDSTVVTLVSFHFKQFQCGSSTADGKKPSLSLITLSFDRG
jgi:hypothetical protein